MEWNTAVILTWAVMYLGTAILVPNIGLNPVMMIAISLLMVLPIILEEKYPKLAADLFLIMGLAETLAAVASWTGIIVWNIPAFGSQALYQVTMAFMDFIAAVALFSKVNLKESN